MLLEGNSGLRRPSEEDAQGLQDVITREEVAELQEQGGGHRDPKAKAKWHRDDITHLQKSFLARLFELACH